MHFLNKIKYNYNVKLIEDHLSNNEFQQIHKLIQNHQQQNSPLFWDLMTWLDNNSTDDIQQRIFNKKIIWIFSFDSEDTKILNSFLEFYMQHTNNNYTLTSYPQKLSENFESLNINLKNKIIEFSDFVNSSSLFQNLIICCEKKEFIILNSAAAFFETNNNKYFFYPKMTSCYFFIHQNPANLYKKYFLKYQSQEAALNELFSKNEKYQISESLNEKNYKIFENRTDWNVHTKSWTDPNVVSTYKGKLINYDHFKNNIEESLIEVLFHLKQYSNEIEIDYSLVEKFVENNNFPSKYEHELSNKERKILSRNIDKSLLKTLDYQF